MFALIEDFPTPPFPEATIIDLAVRGICVTVSS